MKTYVFDASALFAFLQNRPGASKVDELLKEARRDRAKVLMSVINYGEVYGLILRECGSNKLLPLYTPCGRYRSSCWTLPRKERSALPR